MNRSNHSDQVETLVKYDQKITTDPFNLVRIFNIEISRQHMSLGEIKQLVL